MPDPGPHRLQAYQSPASYHIISVFSFLSSQFCLSSVPCCRAALRCATLSLSHTQNTIAHNFTAPPPNSALLLDYDHRLIFTAALAAVPRIDVAVTAAPRLPNGLAPAPLPSYNFT